MAIIYLGRRLPTASCGLPGGLTGEPPVDAAGEPARRSSYLALLQMGFTRPAGHPAAGEALTSPFHPYPLPGGMFLWHFPWGRPRWTLSSIPLCGVRTFLRQPEGCPRLLCF